MYIDLPLGNDVTASFCEMMFITATESDKGVSPFLRKVLRAEEKMFYLINVKLVSTLSLPIIS